MLQYVKGMYSIVAICSNFLRGDNYVDEGWKDNDAETKREKVKAKNLK